MITEVPKKVDARQRILEWLDYSDDSAIPEVLVGTSCDTKLSDIIPVAEIEIDDGSKQSLLQVIDAGGELFGVVAIDGEAGQSLSLVRISDTPIQLCDIGSEGVCIGRSTFQEQTFLDTFSREHFEVTLSPDGETLSIEDLNSTHKTIVRTKLKPDTDDPEKLVNRSTLSMLSDMAARRSSALAPKPETPKGILDGSSWAVSS